MLEKGREGYANPAFSRTPDEAYPHRREKSGKRGGVTASLNRQHPCEQKKRERPREGGAISRRELSKSYRRKNAFGST